MTTLFRQKSIRRFLTIGISMLLNVGLCVSAMLCLASVNKPAETEIAVELQHAPAPKIATALPPPPPRILKLKEQAEEIIKTREEAKKPYKNPVEEILSEAPPAPPPVAPENPLKQQESPPQVSDNPPAPQYIPPAITELPGNGDPAPVTTGNNNSGAGNPGGTGATGGGTSIATDTRTGASGSPAGGTPSDNTPGGGDGNGKTGTGPVETHPGNGNPGNGNSSNNSTKTDPPPSAPKGPSRKSYAKSTPQPSYPADARDEGSQGTVRLRVEIDENGGLTGEPKIVKSSGNRSLDKAALRGVKKWDFEPELVDGKPVSSVQIVDVQFKLN